MNKKLCLCLECEQSHECASTKEIARLRSALGVAREAFRTIQRNDKTVYNYPHVSRKDAMNRDGEMFLGKKHFVGGRWATPLEIATEAIKSIEEVMGE